jgi:hypothetical protein
MNTAELDALYASWTEEQKERMRGTCLEEIFGYVEVRRLKKRDGDDLVTGAEYVTHQPLKDPPIKKETKWSMRVKNFYTDHKDLVQKFGVAAE